MTDGTQQSAYLADFTRAERLRRWVILLGVLFVVANCVTDAYDQWRAYRFAINDSSRELVNTARILAGQAEGTLKSVDVLLRDVADGYPQVDATARIRDIGAALAGRVEGLPQVMSLKIADARGVVRYRSGPFDKDTPVSLDDRSYFTALRDNPTLGLVVSGPIETRVQQRTAIALARRLRDDSGHFAGVASATIDLDKFQQFYHQINLGPHSAIVLLHDDGTLVAREPPVLDRVGKRYPGLVAQLSAEPAARIVSPVDGVARFIAGAHVEGFPLIVAVGREEAAVLDRWRSEVARVAVQDLIVGAVIGLAIAALVHQLTRVERGERALRESEERYALAMEGANEGHFDRDLQADSAFMSPKMRELLGVGPDAPINTRAEALVNVHPDDWPRINSAFQDILERRTDRYEVEY
ncbi:MAG TPA: cache domain-containing protein, partial [Casimicrobiaceae bacterium]